MALDADRVPDRLTDLIADRRQMLMQDGEWSGYTDCQIASALTQLEAIQRAILEIDLGEPAVRLQSLAVLLDGNDLPNFADDFKNQLFEALRKAHLLVSPVGI